MSVLFRNAMLLNVCISDLEGMKTRLKNELQRKVVCISQQGVSLRVTAAVTFVRLCLSDFSDACSRVDSFSDFKEGFDGKS